MDPPRAQPPIEATPGHNRRRAAGAAAILGAAALWGSLGLFGRLLFRADVSPLEVASVRAAIAFVGVLPFALIRPAALRVRGADVPLVIAYGAVGVGLFYYVYLAAIQRLPLATAAALLYTAPAFVVAIAWGMRWEPVRTRRLVPLAMVLAGAFFVTGAFRALGGSADLAGVALGLVSGLSYAIYTVLGKRISGRYGTRATIFFAYGVGAVVLALAAPPWTVLLAHPEALSILLLMGLVPTLLAAALFYGGLRHIEASAASMLATIEPVVAAGIGLVWLGEELAPAAVIGTTLILAAALLLRR